MADTVLEASGITKQFPGACALDSVDFSVRRGEVHALVGGNGAGKSTLMHIIAGVMPPDAGTLRLDGQVVRFRDARQAQAAGIGMVFQEGSLAPPLSVSENVFFARQPVRRFGIIDRDALRRRTRELLDELGSAIDPACPVESLSPAQRQVVEIAKALSLDARLFIFDEPTSALTSEETNHLFEAIRRLRAHGAGIVYISHRLPEIFDIADRVTVMKDGRNQGVLAAADATPERLISLMAGKTPSAESMPEANERYAAPPVLEVESLSDGSLLRDISINVRAGEVVALAGLAGAGRTELAMAVFGARPKTAGSIRVDGRPCDPRAPRDAIAAGIGYVPEDRKESGLFLDMSIAANVASARLGAFGRLWLRAGRMAEVAAGHCRRLDVSSTQMEQPVVDLSGGNQQKVAIAKWLLSKPRILIADEPTRGIDVAAKFEVHAILRQLAMSGSAVLLISSELPEVLAVADRIYVLHRGRITGELLRSEATEEAILRLASLPGGENGKS